MTAIIPVVLFDGHGTARVDLTGVLSLGPGAQHRVRDPDLVHFVRGVVDPLADLIGHDVGLRHPQLLGDVGDPVNIPERLPSRHYSDLLGVVIGCGAGETHGLDLFVEIHRLSEGDDGEVKVLRVGVIVGMVGDSGRCHVFELLIVDVVIPERDSEGPLQAELLAGQLEVVLYLAPD